MIYVYDIVLNFNKELFDFYDWAKDDDVKHYRKIPLVKVNEKVYKYFISNSIKVGGELLELIKDKTQVYVNRLLKSMDYTCIITNGYDSVAVCFDEMGGIQYRSRLSINDEVEVLDLADNLKVKTFLYEKLENTEYKFNYLTRRESAIINEIASKLYKVRDDEELINYLHYEWNGSIYKGSDAFGDLIREVTREYNSKSEEFLKLLNLVVLKKV